MTAPTWRRCGCSRWKGATGWSARGVPCSLLTGEENVPAPGARVVSSTIEMVNTRRPIDMAVIDEAQMIFDVDRGWAWTQAIVGVPANEVIIICSAYAVPAIENLLEPVRRALHGAALRAQAACGAAAARRCRSPR